MDLLDFHTRAHELEVWNEYARIYRGELLLKHGAGDEGLMLIREGVKKLLQARFDRFRTTFLGALAQAEAAVGETEAAMASIDKALSDSEPTGECWCSSELRRIKGELVLLTHALHAAREHFLASVELAKVQNALSWELRAASSLTKLRQGYGRLGTESDLRSVYGRFSEGFGTADLRAARQLLEQSASVRGGTIPSQHPDRSSG